MSRYELSDFEWGVIEPHLPNKVRGVPRVDDRKVPNGILWRFRTGSPWAERYFNKLKQYRGIPTRYDHDPLNFLAAIKLASVRIRLKSYDSAA